MRDKTMRFRKLKEKNEELKKRLNQMNEDVTKITIKSNDNEKLLQKLKEILEIRERRNQILKEGIEDTKEWEMKLKKLRNNKKWNKIKEIEDKIEDNCLNQDGESCKEKADGYYCDNCIIVLYTDVSTDVSRIGGAN